MRLSAIVLLAVFLFAMSASGQAAGGLAAIVDSDIDGPVVVIDLVKFKAGGEEEYNRYDSIAEAKVLTLGGEYLFSGDAKAVRGIDRKWDRLTIRKYPSAQAVADMASSAEYRGAFPHRFAGVAESFVYAFSGELPAFAGSDARDAMNPVPRPDSDDAVYMLNLLRFKPDGGESKYFREYGARTLPLITARHGGPALNLKGIGPVIGDEPIDRLILVRYPSAESFHEMIASEEYQAIAHLRTESIELGLLFSFSFQAED